MLLTNAYAGRFDASILQTATEASLVSALKSAAIRHPLHSSVATIKKGSDKFAGVYIGNRFLLTAAHCVEGLKPNGYSVEFSTYDKSGDLYIKRVIASAKAVAWDLVTKYEIGENDYAVIILDKDPVNIAPAKIWTKKLSANSLPSRESVVISPIAEIDLEDFQGQKSCIKRLSYTERSLHAFYANLLLPSELSVHMRAEFKGKKFLTLTSVMSDVPNYTTVSDKIFGKTRPGDSGSPIFIHHEGEDYLIGLVSGGYVYVPNVKSRDLADLYVHVGNWLQKSSKSLPSLGKKLSDKRIKIETKKLRGKQGASKKLKNRYIQTKSAKNKTGKLLQSLKNVSNNIANKLRILANRYKNKKAYNSDKRTFYKKRMSVQKSLVSLEKSHQKNVRSHLRSRSLYLRNKASIKSIKKQIKHLRLVRKVLPALYS